MQAVDAAIQLLESSPGAVTWLFHLCGIPVLVSNIYGVKTFQISTMECNEFKRESVFFSHEAIEKFGGSVTNGMKTRVEDL